MRKKEMQSVNRATIISGASFNSEASEGENVRLNFSEDEFDLYAADRDTSQTTVSTVPSVRRTSSFNSRFNGSSALLITFGLASCVLQRLSTVTPVGGLVLLFAFLIFMREWYRIYGDWLNKKRRAFLSYKSILKNNSSYIPCYDLQWLFGEKYKGYAYGCCLGDELTEEQPEDCSPPQSPSKRDKITEKKN